MRRRLSHYALRRITLAVSLVLLAGCRENFPDAAAGPGDPGDPGDPAPVAASLDVRNWRDTLVLGAEHPVAVQVLDEDGQPIPGETVTWTITTPSVLGAAAATGDSVGLDALALGTAQITFTATSDPALTATRTVTVLVGGVAASTAQDTTLTALDDTAVVVAAALGYAGGGTTLTPITGQGVTWTHISGGAVTLLENTGDTVRVVAAWTATDTLIATHSQCLAGAACVDTVVVTVDDALDPSNTQRVPGADIVLFGDGSMFGVTSAQNQTVIRNLVDFTNSRPRAAGQRVMLFNGAGSQCAGGAPQCTSMANSWLSVPSSVFAAAGYTTFLESSSLATIPADVKVVVIYMPTTVISAAEVNALKQFASEGGRVVLITENKDYITAGYAAIDQLLSDLGAEMVNLQVTVQCGGSAVAMGAHQLTTGITSTVEIGCASTLGLGPRDIAFLGNGPGEIIGAVARIDLTPLP